ncbi:MAG: thioredoxin domain-containing protein [Dermatophilaceae bacterium]
MRPDAKKKIATVTPKKGPNPVVIGAVVAAVLIVGVVAAILIGNGTKTSGSPSGTAQPAGAISSDGGGIFVNKATVKSNAPTLDLYEDFQCPTCGALEKAMGPTMTSMSDAGDIKFVVHTLTFLDDNLKNDSSKRAANAAACASDAGKFLPYHALVFAAQPAQEGAGYTDAQLTSFATEAGITGPALTTWQKCTSSGQHSQYVADVQDASSRAGINQTPTVKLDGKDITSTLTTPEALLAQVKAATK